MYKAATMGDRKRFKSARLPSSAGTSAIVVKPPYDETFPRFSDQTTLGQLTSSQRQLQRAGSGLCLGSFAEVKRDSFILGFLINITVPKRGDMMYGAKLFRACSDVKVDLEYRMMYWFASLADGTGDMFVVVEHTVENANMLWSRDPTRRDLHLGECLAILCPFYTGRLTDGTDILHTDLPFEVVSTPSLPTTIPNTIIRHSPRKFFVLNSVKISGDTPVACTTLCSQHYCDRQSQRSCVCSALPAREGVVEPSKRTVLRFRNLTLMGDALRDTIVVDSFVSLRTSGLLFLGGVIPLTANKLNTGFARAHLYATWVYLSTYVNCNGGWTAVGFYQPPFNEPVNRRGLSNTATATLENVSYTLTYLYPTMLRPDTMPGLCNVSMPCLSPGGDVDSNL